MSRKILILIVTLCMQLLKAQEDSLRMRSEVPGLHADTVSETQFSRIERTTLRLYGEQKWDSLETACSNALREGTDYYYLRLRLGIAHFEQQRYRAALYHFRKASAMNPSAEIPGQYIYYCYLYTGRPEQAHWYSQYIASLSGGRRRLKLLSVSNETGFKQTDHQAFKNPFFTSTAIGHAVGKRLSLFHAFTYFTQREVRLEVQQLQYYLRGSVPFRNELMVQFAGHYISTGGNLITYTNVPYSTTVQPAGPPGMPPPPPQVVQVQVRQQVLKPFSQPSFIGSASIHKGWRKWALSTGITAAALDTTRQFQLEISAALFPFANNRFSLGSSMIFHAEDRAKAAALAISPWLSWYPTTRVNIHVSAFLNRGNNVTENYGAFVANTADFTRARMAATLSVRLSPATWFYTTYATERKEHVMGIFRYSYQVLAAGFRFFLQ